MKTLGKVIFLSTAALTLGACGNAKTEAPLQTKDTSASVDLSADAEPEFTAYITSADRANIGSVMIRNTPTGISAVIKTEGLTPGLHGMHFHKVGDCSDEGFKLSGGHINPMNKQHGLKNADGPDNADMPNLIVDTNGEAVQTVINDRLSLNGEGGRPALLDADGSALVIHADPDDQMTQPIGGAGKRVACAVVKSET